MFPNFKSKSQLILIFMGLILGLDFSFSNLKASSQTFSSIEAFHLNPFVSAVLPITFLDTSINSRDRAGEYHRLLLLTESYSHLSNYRDFKYENGEDYTDYEFTIGHRFDYE